MSTPDETSPRDLAAAYALGALSPEEARAFESYLATSPEARQEVAELRETAALVALSAPEAQPGPGLRARVLDAVAAGKVRPLPAPPASVPSWPAARRPSPLVWGALAASLLAAVGLGVRSARLAGELAQRDSTIAQQTRTLADQGQQLAARDSTLASVLSPGVELVQLTASGDPDPRIQLFWDRQHNTALLHASKLKPVPQGRTYQLWFIKDGKPVPSVTFNVAPAGDAVISQVSVPAEGQVSAAAVTEEPAGGSPQPTTPVLLVGALPKT
ncbi:MAG TPA: anti-sigma factor [Gemmatimonadales bacterium]|nr:anti-sigma factor [Gemmatimonadales bacterium]